MSLALRQTVSPIPVDLDPNTAEPDPSRTFEVPSRFSTTKSEGYQLGIALKDGTSLDVTVWLKSGELSSWVREAAPRTVLAREVRTIDGLPGGSTVFLQLTNAVGAPTAVGFFLL